MQRFYVCAILLCFDCSIDVLKDAAVSVVSVSRLCSYRSSSGTFEPEGW